MSDRFSDGFSGHAARQLGADVRRGWSPEDRARAEGLVARYGGILTYSTGAVGAGYSVEWTGPTGQRVAIDGRDVATGLTVLSAMLRDGGDTVSTTHTDG